MKQKKLINIQSKLRNKFLRNGVKMIAPETVFFSKSTKIGKNVTIEPYVVISDKVSVGDNVRILSFSHLEGVKIENNVNIGAGTITCNYDGIKKSKKIIGDEVFVGSNSSLVAPLTIGEKSIVGAGSVITKDVSKKSLALTRSQQLEIKNYKRKAQF